MKDGVDYRCGACGAPLATLGFSICRYCSTPNAAGIPRLTEPKATLDGDLTLLTFSPTPLFTALPCWVRAPEEKEPSLLVLPAVSASSSPGALGLAHYLAERLLLDADVPAASTALLDHRTHRLHTLTTTPSRRDWDRALAGRNQPPAVLWAELQGPSLDDLARLRMVSAEGRETSLQVPVHRLADAAIDWALQTWGRRPRPRRPAWYVLPSREQLPGYLLAAHLRALALFAEGAGSPSALGQRTFAAMARRCTVEEVQHLFDAILGLHAQLGASLPQLALLLVAAMTAAEERDALDPRRSAPLVRLASEAPAGSLLHALSPWVLAFLDQDRRAAARFAALRPRAFGAYAEWLDAIEMAEPPSGETLAILARLPTCEGPRDLRACVGLGQVEFGSSLDEVTRALGEARPVPDAEGSFYLLMDGAILAEFEEDQLVSFETEDPSVSFHGTNPWRLDEPGLLAFLERTGLHAGVEEDEEGEREVFTEELGVLFTFRAGRLASIAW
ncbi:MAG: hypothetical protein MUF64_13675 [Polyangiaceae bacterium]|jgi:hypothetical protein|nr:hypothetical protein [Polyangiaceae bacterium]